MNRWRDQHYSWCIASLLVVLFMFAPLDIVLAAGAEGAVPAKAAILNETQAALDANDYVKALSLAEKAVKNLPSTSEAYRMRGSAWIRLNKPQEALRDNNRAIELDPLNNRAFAGRAVAHQQLGNLDAALRDASRAVEIKPDYSAGFGIRGDILKAQKRYALAIADFDQSLRLNPNNGSSLCSRAEAKSASGDRLGEIEDYNAAEKLGLNSPSLYFNRGHARLVLKDNAGAEEDFSRSIHQALKEGAGPEQDATRPIELSQRYAWAYAVRGEIRLDRGAHELARQDLARALELDPASAYAKQKMSKLDPKMLAENSRGTKALGESSATKMRDDPRATTLPGESGATKALSKQNSTTLSRPVKAYPNLSEDLAGSPSLREVSLTETAGRMSFRVNRDAKIIQQQPNADGTETLRVRCSTSLEDAAGNKDHGFVILDVLMDSQGKVLRSQIAEMLDPATENLLGDK